MPHPYVKFENSALWGVIEREIQSLVDNNDLVETTARQYIVGALCKALDGSGLLAKRSSTA